MFKYDEKETYSHEELKEILEQKAKYTKKSVATEFEEKVEAERKLRVELETSIKEQNAKKAEAEIEAFKAAVPEKSKKIIEKLLKVNSIDEIKTEFPDLLEATDPKQVPDWTAEIGKPKAAAEADKDAAIARAKSGKGNDEDMKVYLNYLKAKK